jgi:hypothetical protein
MRPSVRRRSVPASVVVLSDSVRPLASQRPSSLRPPAPPASVIVVVALRPSSLMENNSNLRDFLSQAAESSSSARISHGREAPEEDLGVFYQTQLSRPPSISAPATRLHIEDLDLNSLGNDFPNLSSYQEVLQSNGATPYLGLPPLGRGIRTGRTPCQFPRSSAGAMRSRGGSQVFRGRGGSRGCRGGRGRATVTRGGRSGVNPTTDHALVQDLEHEEENELDARSPMVRKCILIFV